MGGSLWGAFSCAGCLPGSPAQLNAPDAHQSARFTACSASRRPAGSLRQAVLLNAAPAGSLAGALKLNAPLASYQIQDGGRPRHFKNLKYAITRLRIVRSSPNFARRCRNGCKFEFLTNIAKLRNPRWRTAAILKIKNKCSELENRNWHQCNWSGIKTANIKYTKLYQF